MSGNSSPSLDVVTEEPQGSNLKPQIPNSGRKNGGSDEGDYSCCICCHNSCNNQHGVREGDPVVLFWKVTNCFGFSVQKSEGGTSAFCCGAPCFELKD